MLVLAKILAETSSVAVVGVVLAIALGLSGAIVALIRLPSDKRSAAVTQIHDANEALVGTIQTLERERDYWRNAYYDCAKRKEVRNDRTLR